MVDLDKSNRSVSILRYLLIFTSKNLDDVFITEEIIKSIRAIIYEYFTKTQKDGAKLVSTYIYPNYIEINFQTLPTLNLVKFISNMKSVTARYFLKAHPQIKEKLGGCWNKSYFLATSEQMVHQHVETYLNEQFALRAVDRILMDKNGETTDDI